MTCVQYHLGLGQTTVKPAFDVAPVMIFGYTASAQARRRGANAIAIILLTALNFFAYYSES